mmetsp:Transcript_16790/g.48768  ORF Transcript_16790/g.48768 Transcript_16790/m.48768 type:complete len:252 (+) Transcript_16790:746-1501(+)
MPAPLEQVRDDDIVRLVAGRLHVLQQLQGPLEIMPVDQGLDQHRVRDDVRSFAVAGLHLAVQFQGLVDAVGSEQAFDEGLDKGRAGGAIHALRSPRQQVHDGGGRIAARVVDDASVEEGAEGDVVGLDALRNHLLRAVRATLRKPGLGKSLDDGVVGDRVHKLGLRPLEAMRLAQPCQPPLRLLRVNAGQQQEVEHQGRGRGPQLLEGRLRGVNIIAGHMRAEEEDVVLRIDGSGAIPLQHRHRPVRVAHF